MEGKSGSSNGYVESLSFNFSISEHVKFDPFSPTSSLLEEKKLIRLNVTSNHVPNLVSTFNYHREANEHAFVLGFFHESCKSVFSTARNLFY